MDIYLFGLVIFAILIPLVWYIMSKMKSRSTKEKGEKDSEGEYVEIAGFGFTESIRPMADEKILIRHETHGWPAYKSGELITINGERWILNETWIKDKKLNKAKLDKLKETIRLGFFKLPPRISESFQDGSAELWSVNLDGRKHRVLIRIFNENKTPELIKKLQDSITL